MPVQRTIYAAADLSGQTFGRLTILRFSHEPQPHRRFWACRCACGRERTLREDYIKSSRVTCAACRRLEIAARQGPRRCPGCQQMLARDQFTRDKTTVDGLRRYCVSCSQSKAARLRTRRSRRRPEEIVLPETKRCRACGLTKPADEFWSDRTQTDGLATTCSECKTQRQRAWYWRVGRGRRLPKARLARYGMTAHDLETLLIAQAGRCAICDREFDGPRSFQIDHDHVTGVVRGVLCPPCNVGLGWFKESPDALRAAIAYLSREP